MIVSQVSKTNKSKEEKQVKKLNPLTVIDGETLMDMRLPKTTFCIDTLLPQGISMLGGSPKIGKSWLVLDWCIRIAKGEPIWNMQTKQGTTLYLCLEDPLRRVQDRLNKITDDVPPNAFFAVCAETLADGLCEQIKGFVAEHPDTVFVAIDTFQIIRNGIIDTSYANDYSEVRQLKQLADELNISLLLVHHLRKQGDSDPINKLSGTTGISGAMDALFVLDKSKRNGNCATLICSSRESAYRELELQLSDNCIWDLRSDSLDEPQNTVPTEIIMLTEMMKEQKFFRGGNSEFTELFNLYSSKSISAKALKQLMNRWRYTLEDGGVYFESYRSNGQRFIYIYLSSVDDESAVSDVETTGGKTSVFCVPSVPVSRLQAICGDINEGEDTNAI